MNPKIENRMKIKISAFVFVIIFCMPGVSEAQILNRIMREAKREVQRKVEDKVVDAATDAIVRAAMRPIEESFDKMLREAYEKDSTERAESPRYADSAQFDYSAFLEQMNRKVELPDSYEFSLSMDLTIEQGEDRNEFTWHFSPDGNHMAMEQMDKKGKKTIILIDFARDVNVLYSEDKDGKKTGQAIPAMTSFISSMAVKEAEANHSPTDVRKTGTYKTVAGYRCAEYRAETEDDELVFYAAPDFPMSWSDSYAGLIEQYAPENAREEYEQIEGMVLESVSKEKKGKGEETRMTTTRVDERGWTLSNSEYSLTGLQE